MKRILYLSPGVFDKGGISRYTRFQSRALRDLLGADAVTVLSLLPPGPNGFEEPFAVDFASFGPTRRGKAFFGAAAALSALSERPSVVWAAHLGFAALALALARTTGARSLVNIYGVEVWTDLRRSAAAGLRGADRIVSDCHNTRDYAITHGLCRPERAVVHWDCVDTRRFTPDAARDESVLLRHGVPPSEGRFTVLTLGRMDGDAVYKGYDRLIDVIARIPASARVRLVLGGDGPMRGDLEARARAHGVAERVFFTGRVREDDLPAFYRSGDVFSLITDAGHGRGEGIPLTPLEAAACGRPILVGNQDGSREAADDGVSGFVLDPFDLAAIQERILRLAGDPALAARMGAAARARIERDHTYERFRGRTEELLRDLALLG